MVILQRANYRINKIPIKSATQSILVFKVQSWASYEIAITILNNKMPVWVISIPDFTLSCQVFSVLFITTIIFIVLPFYLYILLSFHPLGPLFTYYGFHFNVYMAILSVHVSVSFSFAPSWIRFHFYWQFDVLFLFYFITFYCIVLKLLRANISIWFTCDCMYIHECFICVYVLWGTYTPVSSLKS